MFEVTEQVHGGTGVEQNSLDGPSFQRGAGRGLVGRGHRAAIGRGQRKGQRGGFAGHLGWRPFAPQTQPTAGPDAMNHLHPDKPFYATTDTTRAVR